MSEALSETPIGPNRCHTCGGEYGQHEPGCKVGRFKPEEVSMLEVLLENRKLKGQLASLRAQATSDAQTLTGLREKLERAQGDTARLDWLCQHRWLRLTTHQFLRDAIDAAKGARSEPQSTKPEEPHE